METIAQLVKCRANTKRRLTRLRHNLTRELAKDAPSPHYLLRDWQQAERLAAEINATQARIRDLTEQATSSDVEDRLEQLDKWEFEFDDDLEVLRDARTVLQRENPSGLATADAELEAIANSSRSSAPQPSPTTSPAAALTSVSFSPSAVVVHSKGPPSAPASPPVTAVSPVPATGSPATPVVPSPNVRFRIPMTPDPVSDTDSDSDWSSSSSAGTRSSGGTSRKPKRSPSSRVPGTSVRTGGSAATSATPPPPSAKPAVTAIHLPKLTVPTFSGDTLSWPAFWDMFSASVDAQPLPDVSKFTYLRTALSGPPNRLIAGLAVTNDNYPIALQALREEYGKPEVIVTKLYRHLQQLPPSSSQLASIKVTQETVHNLLRQLEAQGETLRGQNLVSQQILSKFPLEVTTKLEEWRPLSEASMVWDVKTLMQALKRYVTLHERAQQRSSFSDHPMTAVSDHVASGSALLVSAAQQQTTSPAPSQLRHSSASQKPSGFRSPCVYCGGNHGHDDCLAYGTEQTRKAQLLKTQRCFRCLGKGHQAAACTRARTCRHCQITNRHHASICPTLFASQHTTQAAIHNPPLGSQQPEHASDPPGSPTTVASGHGVSTANVYLQTAKVTLHNGGQSLSARVLLDSGSQRTFLTSSAAESLGLPVRCTEYLHVSTFASSGPQRLQANVVDFELALQDGSLLPLTAHVLPKITDPVHRSAIPDQDRQFLQSLSSSLADNLPDTSEKASVDLLIGTDYFWSIIQQDRIVLPSGLLLLPSRLGYILTGCCAPSHDDSSQTSTLLCHTAVRLASHQLQVMDSTPRSTLTPNLTEMWNLDRIGIHDCPDVTADDLALRHFQDHIQFTGGRYEVAWPWKSEPPDLPTNYGLAFGRLSTLCRRLANDSDLRQQYDKVIQSQVDLGIIEPVANPPPTGTPQHYLPHQPVITPSKQTTKLRIVYDASAKTTKQSKSLNECMHRGPIRLPNLCGMLLRFRCYNVAIVADIEKAFLQLRIRKEDRDVTRFLWLRDATNPHLTKDNLAVYRFCRMPFGVIASPFLLEATIRHHLQRHPSPLSETIARNIYVDNVVIGVRTDEEALPVHDQAKSIFAEASMNLREWTSSSAVVRAALPEDDLLTSRRTKVLGLLWDTHADVLTIPESKMLRCPSQPVTKRTILSGLSSLYDPLGLLLPITLQARLLLRELWQVQLDWDSPLPAHLADRWAAISTMMSTATSLPVPRLCGPVATATDVQLHIFTDASAEVYAAVAYLRISVGEVHHSGLIYSKLRLAPMPKLDAGGTASLTIPRLELLGVTIGARLSRFLHDQLHLPISSTTLWTDSKCVLHWLASRRDLSTFVQNRIRVLRSHTSISYCYVPTLDNPADLATRPQTMEQLTASTLWWKGPRWLLQEPSQWPQKLVVTPDVMELAATEVRGPKVLHGATLIATAFPQSRPAIATTICDRVSSLERLIRISFYVCNFIQQRLWSRLLPVSQSRLRTTHPLLCSLLTALASSSHLNAASRRLILAVLIRMAQLECFADVFQSFATNNHCPIRGQLGVAIDDHGLLQCHGRLALAGHPALALLPATHRLTRLVITDVHCRLLHAGTAHTLAHLRLNFWVPQGRRAVRSILRNCTVCRRHEGPPYKLPSPPALPKERVVPAAPFEYVGLDYFGPILVKQADGTTTSKVWVCLLTCLAVRAVHLEWVIDMTALQFIACFRRFVARRGVPRLLYSDNASQFKAASGVLDQLWSTVATDPGVANYFTSQGITWKFTTAFAPWQGGVYERMVGLVKRSLRKALGRQHLRLDQLATLLAEAEAAVNSRPLTSVTADYEGRDVEILTPAHFLLGSRPAALPLSTALDDPEYTPPSTDPALSLLTEWRHRQTQSELFWSLWRTDYLQVLQERMAHTSKRQHCPKPSPEPSVGEVVLVDEETAPRCMWKLARVVALEKSQTDGAVRAARIITSTGKEVNRPVCKLYGLECRQVPTELPETASEVPVTAPASDNPQRPTRAAADKARQNIAKWTAVSLLHVHIPHA
eukprot:scpid5610/ scgid2568/ 